MSLATWKKEFYSPITKVSEKNALAHSLKKWEGLRHKNLKKHNVVAFEGDLTNEDKEREYEFPINCTTCALCKWNSNNTKRNYSCRRCPLYQDGDRCYKQYLRWTEYHDPVPMIHLIKQTIAQQEKLPEAA